MKIRFPLYAKILFWFFTNLLLLAVAGWFFFNQQFHFSTDSLLAGRAGDHIESVKDLILTDLHETPREKWNEKLKQFGVAYHVRFFLFRNDGPQIAGETIELPGQVREQLVEPMPPPGRPRPGMPGPKPPLGDVRPPRDFPGDRPGPVPDGPGEPFPGFENGRPPVLDEMPPEGRQNPPQPRHKLMLHTAKPSNYWLLMRAGLSESPRRPPVAATLVALSDSLSFGGLFFDYKPLLLIGAGALLFSVLLWLPFVSGLTRSIAQMTRATEKIAEGGFDARVPENRRDELGSLGGAINRMAARLAGFVGGQKRFLGDIAHELCTPIARMQMALGILENHADEKQSGYVGDVREELQHMSSLVNELLSFSKASLGASRIKLQPVALQELVEKAVARESTPDATIKVEVTGELRAQADPELLLRSVANLVRNGIRYAAHAGPITIIAARHDDKVTLTVTDCGPGIPPESLAQIFDPFYRVDTSRARETGGVGLGLAIVKTCVESCGGTVAAENLPQGGLEVTIKLQAAG